ncbi:MAG TPA: hypothetical protein VFW45_11110 [Candidatus Polarisedimenticolia bacterium]|nr:hypothetical protein [Candidatus Polarisedimenticolia bacterium]
MTDRSDTDTTFRSRCGFLSAADLQDFLDGRLAAARQEEFDRHVAGGCAECVTLAADLEVYRRLIKSGPSESERREAEQQAETLRERLRKELRRRNLTST